MIRAALSRLLPNAGAAKASAKVSRRSLDGATGGRRGGSLGTFGPVNSEVNAAAPIIGQRAAYLAQNNPWLSNGVQNIVSYAVGTGARPTPRSVTRDERRRLMRDFERWSDTADHAGRTDFGGLQVQMARDIAVYGETLALMHVTDAGLQIQVIPPEHLDRSKTAMIGEGRYIANGVEHDAQGRRVAYWIMPDLPSSAFATAAPSARIPAEDVVHGFQPIGAGQVRGLSWLAPAILPAAELDQLQDALLMSAKIAAQHAGFIKDHGDTGSLEWDGDTAWEPGSITRLPSGTDVVFNSPEQLKDTPAFLRLNLQAVAAALGIPEHLLSGDLTNANYSSLRAGLLPFRTRMEQFQHVTLVPQLLRPIWRRWLAIQGDGDTEVDWLFPRPQHVDPGKDVAAIREALELGLMSRTQAIAELGWNADDVDEQIAADRERETEMGLCFHPKKESETDAS